MDRMKLTTDELMVVRTQHTIVLDIATWQEIRRRLERLEKCEALSEYAWHHSSCEFLDSVIGKAIPCTCGYEVARAALEEK